MNFSPAALVALVALAAGVAVTTHDPEAVDQHRGLAANAATACPPLPVQQSAIIDPRASEAESGKPLLPKEEGITQLLNAGTIRPALNSDLVALECVILADNPFAARDQLGLRELGPDTFVVMRQTQIPEGMYGAHSATFLIWPGAPFPTDPGSHNTYYRMSDGGCRGVLCRV